MLGMNPFNSSFTDKSLFQFGGSSNSSSEQKQMIQFFADKHTSNIGNIPDCKIRHFLKDTKPCSNCYKKKTYICLETECTNQRVLCPDCDIFNVDGKHFQHKFQYIISFFKDKNLVFLRQLQSNISNEFIKLTTLLMNQINKIEKLKKQISTNLFLVYKNINEKTSKQLTQKIGKNDQQPISEFMLELLLKGKTSNTKSLLIQQVKKTFLKEDKDFQTFSSNSKILKNNLQIVIQSHLKETLQQITSLNNRSDWSILNTNKSRLIQSSDLNVLISSNLCTQQLEYSSVMIKIPQKEQTQSFYVQNFKNISVLLHSFHNCQQLCLELSFPLNFLTDQLNMPNLKHLSITFNQNDNNNPNIFSMIKAPILQTLKLKAKKQSVYKINGYLKYFNELHSLNLESQSLSKQCIELIEAIIESKLMIKRFSLSYQSNSETNSQFNPFMVSRLVDKKQITDAVMKLLLSSKLQALVLKFHINFADSQFCKNLQAHNQLIHLEIPFASKNLTGIQVLKKQILKRKRAYLIIALLKLRRSKHSKNHLAGKQHQLYEQFLES